MKRREPQHIGAIIAQAIHQAGATEAFNRQKVCSLWVEVVGPAINRLTVRRWVDRDTLHVVITSAAVKQELMFMRSRLAQMLNSAAGQNLISSVVIH